MYQNVNCPVHVDSILSIEAVGRGGNTSPSPDTFFTSSIPTLNGPDLVWGLVDVVSPSDNLFRIQVTSSQGVVYRVRTRIEVVCSSTLATITAPSKLPETQLTSAFGMAYRMI